MFNEVFSHLFFREILKNGINEWSGGLVFDETNLNLFNLHLFYKNQLKYFN